MTKKAFFVGLVAAAAAVAQPPQGKGQGKGRDRASARSNNGPGGISWTAVGYNGLAIVRLLEVPEVQAELKLTKDDLAALPPLRDELKESSARFEKSLVEAASKGREALIETLVNRSKEVDQQLGEVLGPRFKRFQEIRRQALGVTAANTSDAIVREALAITEDQRAKYNTELENLRKGFADGNLKTRDPETGKIDDNAADKGMRDFTSRENKLFLSLLTDTQKAKWQELLGAPFEVPQEVLRFVRRGRFETAGEGDRPTGDQTPRDFGKGRRKRGMKGGQPSGGGGDPPPPSL